MRKPAFCICENKDADQLRGNNREADQRLCFCYIASSIPLYFLKSKFQASEISSAVVQPGLCRIWSETPNTGFLTTRLIFEGKVKGEQWPRTDAIRTTAPPSKPKYQNGKQPKLQIDIIQ